MDPRALRIGIVVLLLAGLGTGAALLTHGSGSDPLAGASPSASPTKQYCLPVPAADVEPSWFPKDLPLPSGSYASRFALNSGRDFNQKAWVVPVPLRTFVQHVLDKWPARGWVLGRGDAELGEAEDTFFKQSPRIAGAFRASSVLCDTTKTLVIIALGVQRAVAPVASPTGTYSPTPLTTLSATASP